MNENGNEKCSLLLFVARFGLWCVFPFCRSLLFAALRCSFLSFEIVNSISKDQNRQMLLVALLSPLSVHTSFSYTVIN